MNAVHIGKTVYSDKRVPHFVDGPEKATHRYLSEKKKWKYMEADKPEDFTRWSSGWMTPDRKPQRKVAGTWRDL